MSSHCWRISVRSRPSPSRPPDAYGPRDPVASHSGTVPLACQWEVTCRCNLHCVMCYTDCFNVPEQIRRELPLSDLLRILDQLAEAGTLELCITGGEPLMRPDFSSSTSAPSRWAFW
ncbi:MAG: radical SAM protein [Nitrospiraceae bacterium]